MKGIFKKCFIQGGNTMSDGQLYSSLLDFHLADPQKYKNLTLYPIICLQDSGLAYLLLEEALKQNHVDVEEIGKGEVSELRVTNKSDSDVLIVSGEELIGGKQNRTVNISILVSAKSALNIPVSCTEKGRWRESIHGKKMTSTSNHYSSSFLRKSMVDSVSESLKDRGSYKSDQGGVWRGITRSLTSHNFSSNTEAQHDLFTANQKNIEEYESHFSITPDQIGVLSFIDGKPKGIDLFNSTITMGKIFPKIIKSYAIDALGTFNNSTISDPPLQKEPEEYFHDILNANTKKYTAPGKGEHQLIETSDVKGMALTLNDEILHLYAG
jgi:hypothetical protein